MIAFHQGVHLAAKTSLKVGGKAAWYCEPAGEPQVREALDFASRRNLPVFVLGKGTNVCISDKGLAGLVINVSTALRGIEWDATRAYCLGGTLLHDLVLASVRRGFAGAQMLAGIPGTIAGALVMNAGAFGQSFGSIVDSVSLVEPQTGETRVVHREDLSLEYRSSSLKQCIEIVTGVACAFEEGDREELCDTVASIVARRKGKHPLDRPNCGSVFKNPPGSSAGRLIEYCGIKGFSIDGVQISTKHANFFVTSPGATAEAFRCLVGHVQRTVYERRGIMLDPEVLFIGSFDNPLFVPDGDGHERKKRGNHD